MSEFTIEVRALRTDGEGFTIVKWPDSFVVALRGAEKAEDPTFRDELIAIAEKIRAAAETSAVWE